MQGTSETIDDERSVHSDDLQLLDDFANLRSDLNEIVYCPKENF